MKRGLLVLLVLSMLIMVGVGQSQPERSRNRPHRPRTDEELLRDPTILNHLKVKNDLTDRMKEILRNADEFEIIELEPPKVVVQSEGADSGGASEQFRESRILRKVSIKSPRVRRRLLDAFDANLTYMFNMILCHDSRHGIRATRGGESVEIELDFTCGKFRAYMGDESVTGWLRREIGPAFNRALRQVGVKFRIA